ncbi:beta strand repeat-containing protein [Mesorhizobium neociceri]|nr:cadherin domain-containing protein [Mesorhizobium neociceri]
MGAGSDFVDGGDSQDAIDYSRDNEGGTATHGVFVNLSDTEQTSFLGTAAAGTAIDLYGDTDTLQNIEDIIGSEFADVLVGDGEGYEGFQGLGGDDILTGGSGDSWAYYDQDIHHGGSSGVTVNLSDEAQGGQAANSATDGFGDTDTLVNINKVRGTQFADTVYGGDQSFSQYQMGAGSDFVDGGDSQDAIDYSRDNEGGTATHGVFVNLSDTEQTSFLGTAAAGTAIDLYGDTDTLQNIEDIIGSEFADVLVGDGEGYEGFQGLGGDDILTGGSGDSWAYYDQDIHHGGGSGVTVNLSDEAQGGQAANSATDGFGDTDMLVNINKVSGTIFGDTVYGGDQSFSQFQMGAGDDFVDGGGGEDMIDYSRDNDGTASHGVFVNLSGTTQTSFLGTAGPHSAIDLFGDTDTVINIEDARGSDFADYLFGNAGDNFLMGEGGNDTLLGNGGADTFIGGAGNDTMDGGAGSDTLDYGSEGGSHGVVVNLLGDGGVQGGLPSDTAIDTFGDTDSIARIPNVIGTQFADEIYGGNHDNNLSGGDGDDILKGGALDDVLDGGADSDTVIYEGTRADYQVDLNPDGSLTIADLRAGSPEGTDTVSNVELFQFADGQKTFGELLNPAPVITSDGGDDTAQISIPENTTAVTTVEATDPDAGDTLTYSTVGGSDQNLFQIDSQTGELSLIQPEDYENPSLNGGAFDHLYDVQVRATDSQGSFDEQLITVTLTNQNDNAPVFSSGTTANFAENATGTVYDANASDADNLAALTYVLSGADSTLFDITASTGVVTFKNAPDFENPLDQGTNNVYDITVTASDGTLNTAQNVAITVTDVSGVTQVGNPNKGDTLTGTSEGDNLSGLGGNDTLIGLAGDDILDGGSGRDVLTGSTGSDTYVVDDKGDSATENANEGTDTVQSNITYTLRVNFENLILTGSNPIDGTGNALDNSITGNSSNNTLSGLAGADVLNGLTGSDTASYATSTSGVNVNLAAGTGSGGDSQGDTLINIENLVGSAFNDVLEGDPGDNVLIGAGGIDTVSYEHAFSGVTVSLAVSSAQNTVGAGLDTISLFENLTGSAFNDRLTANSGSNILTGLAGQDQFIFNNVAGSSAAAPDRIADFVHGADLIDLSAIDANTSNKPAFKGDQTFAFAGQDASVIANSVTWYEAGGNTFVQADVDGKGGADFVLELTGIGLGLTATDFLL